jgi:hypothetical protein
LIERPREGVPVKEAMAADEVDKVALGVEVELLTVLEIARLGGEDG